MTFANVLKLFREQKVSVTGNLVAYDPKYLVTPASMEASIRNEVKLAGMEEVEVLAHTDVTSLYLLAVPELAPIIVKLGMGATPHLSLSAVPNMSRAIAVMGDNVFVFAPVSRYGIVRLSPA
jgi:hypothetical protein